MKICFTGDVFLGGDLKGKSCRNVVESYEFNNSDLRVVNLEQAISDNEEVIDKCTLYTGSESLVQLKELKVDFTNLAHNHIQDKGTQGIIDTSSLLKQSGFKPFGAGENLAEAQKPQWLTDDIAILGYCDYGKYYLNQITIADDNTPGINPLSLAKIKSDLSLLPEGKKAVIYLHWGMEHVWLPPSHDINLVKKILEDDRVITVLGMHCHRVQGIIEHAGKKAYMSLGNFLFPNFYIDKPTQIAYLTNEEKAKVKFTTRQYHHVYQTTYKKWRKENRVSLIIIFDTESYEIKHKFVVQSDNEPKITELKGLTCKVYQMRLAYLGCIYKIPIFLYKPLWCLHASKAQFFWRLKNNIFHFKQLGFKCYINKVVDYAKKRFS